MNEEVNTLQIDTSDTSAPRESEARTAVSSDALFTSVMKLCITVHATVISNRFQWACCADSGPFLILSFVRINRWSHCNKVELRTEIHARFMWFMWFMWSCKDIDIDIMILMNIWYCFIWFNITLMLRWLKPWSIRSSTFRHQLATRSELGMRAVSSEIDSSQLATLQARWKARATFCDVQRCGEKPKALWNRSFAGKQL